MSGTPNTDAALMHRASSLIGNPPKLEHRPCESSATKRISCGFGVVGVIVPNMGNVVVIGAFDVVVGFVVLVEMGTGASVGAGVGSGEGDGDGEDGGCAGGHC